MRHGLGSAIVAVLGAAATSAAWGQASDRMTEARAAVPAPAYELIEEDVALTVDGEKVVGTLALPEGATPGPVVLMLHGFTGSRDELGIEGTDEGVFSRTARLWAERGLSSLRIDFRGSGDSDGAWEDTTFTGQITDALAAVEWLASDPRVDPERIMVLGWSQGGLVASATAAGDPRVRTLALWAPVAHPAVSYPALFGQETVAAGLASGGEPVDVTLSWGAEIELRTGFFEELYTVDPLVKISRYSGPLLVIVGTRDTVVAPQPLAGQAYIANHEGDEELIVLDTDHVFDAFTGPEMVDEMALWTLAWFHQTL
jgi:uncharacterized protein